MPKRTYEISESPEELLHMMKNEKKGRFRDRLRLLWLLKSGEAETMTRAAGLCGVSRLTAAEWFHRYGSGGIGELLLLKTVPGRKRRISGEAEDALRKRLAEPDGFGSYDEIRIWLRENHHIDIPYKTVHKTVRYHFGAKPKMPRPSHIKKNDEEVQEFKETFPTEINEIIENTDMPVKLFSYDETRLGLITSLGRRITLPGVRPVARIQRVFENYHIYGAVGISDGKNLFFEFPGMNTDCFQNFIEIFSEEFSDSMNVLLIDNAGIHKAKRLVIPQNIRLIFLPAYSPELNPIERFWQHMKQYIKGKIFSGLQEMKDYVADILKKCSEETVASLTGFPYILNSINV
jgi:transposase